jgi:integrase
VLPGRATVGSPNTVANYRQVLATHVLPVLGGRRLRDLRVEDVEGVLRSMAARGYSRSTVARVRAVLVMALTHAERRGLLARNVARLAEMPACRPPAERRALTFEEARRLLDAAAGDRLGAMWVTGLLLGLRPGELTGLCWEDVDLDAGVLHVRRALRRLPDGTLAFGPLKTARSRRSLDMPAPVVEALRRHRAAMAAERLAAGGAWPERWAGLVFVSEAGTALDPSNLRRHFERVCAAAGVGRLRPYELRHSAASLLSAAGVHAEVVGDVLGHDGTRMVAQVYRHAVAPTVRAAAETWERVLGGGGR